MSDGKSVAPALGKKNNLRKIGRRPEKDKTSSETLGRKGGIKENRERGDAVRKKDYPGKEDRSASRRKADGESNLIVKSRDLRKINQKIQKPKNSEEVGGNKFGKQRGGPTRLICRGGGASKKLLVYRELE